jgi:YmgG-like glycine-zipper protein
MKRHTNTVAAALATTILAIGGTAALAQTSKTFVYPQKGQSQDQQAKDDAECRSWAKGQSGVNPEAPPPPAQAGTHARGTARGAAKGAAVGAAVGAIGGDAGKGAAAGAVVGGAAGRHRSKTEQQAQQAAASDSFQRAFGACMEARGYSVK